MDAAVKKESGAPLQESEEDHQPGGGRHGLQCR